MLVPEKRFRVRILTTPATASDPYKEVAPSFKISIRSIAISGIIFTSTYPYPSWDGVPECVCLRVLISNSVEA